MYVKMPTGWAHVLSHLNLEYHACLRPKSTSSWNGGEFLAYQNVIFYSLIAIFQYNITGFITDSDATKKSPLESRDLDSNLSRV